MAGIASAIAIASCWQLAAQAPAQSSESLVRTRLLVMQRQLRGLGEIQDARAGALQKVQKLMTGDDRKLSAWREVQSFEDRINARMEELSRMLETAIAADKNDRGGIDDQILASTLQTDRVFEQTILSLIRLSNQQATALAVLPRTGKFAMLQWQIDNTVRAAEDWRRQWSNIIADEEDLSTRITTP